MLGENGAGKSTLIKIMSGVVQPDSGTMELEGRPVRFEVPADAMRAGVVCNLPGTVAGTRPHVSPRTSVRPSRRAGSD